MATPLAGRMNPPTRDPKFTLTFPDGAITLNVNPERLQRSSPTRVEVVQTLTGAVVDHFGAGLGSGSISGTTGWGRPLASRGSGGGQTGREQWERLKQLFERWQDTCAQAADPGSSANLVDLFNEIDGEHLQVVPMTLTWTRSIGRLLLYEYTIDYRTMYDFAAPFRYSGLPQLNGTGTVSAGDTPPYRDPRTGDS